MSLAKDQSLTIVITGKPDDVMRAKRDLITKLQTQVLYELLTLLSSKCVASVDCIVFPFSLQWL